ncbi:MAG: hypothetical protein ACR2NR_22735 [Solirubrobacteraceae bacterium]
MQRNSRFVSSTTDGARNARDPKLKQRLTNGERVKVRREVRGGGVEIQADHRDVVVEGLKADGYSRVIARG